MTSPYDVLGVPWDADDEAIRVAFRKAAKIYHPDLNAGDEAAAQRFKQIAAARDAILKSEPEAGPGEEAGFDATLLEDRYVRRKWRIIQAGGVIGALATAFLISGAISVGPPLIEVASLAGPAGAAVERLIRPPDTADTEPRADRPMAYANDEAIVEVTARESEEDFPRDWPETKVDMADRRADVAATAPVLRTSAVPPSIRHDDDGPWWAFTSGFAAAVSGWPTESDGKAPATNAARSKPGASRSRPAVERPRAARSASAAVAPKTRSRNSSEAPRDRIAAPARLRPMDVAPTSEPQLASRPAYTFHGCWTDEGHGRWSPCGGNGGGGGGGGGGE